MGFYDAKGYWRTEGECFYDSRGNLVSPGGAYYDGKGYLRSPGDGFYDSKGNWVSPGSTFYDGKGYLQSSGVAVGAVVDNGTSIVITVGFLLLLPILFLWMMTMFLVEWVTSHLYLIFVGYAIADALLCCIITKLKKHYGTSAVLSFIGNYMCIFSFLYITLVYAVPYMMTSGESLGSFFEFTAALAMGAAGVTILQCFNYLHQHACWELILGCLFFAVVALILRYEAGNCYTAEYLAGLYHVRPSKLFLMLFGFVA